MWISKKKWMELQMRVAKAEFDLQNKPVINNVFSQYADNEKVYQELRIFLAGPDLCKLQSQEFYQDLMKFLDNL